MQEKLNLLQVFRLCFLIFYHFILQGVEREIKNTTLAAKSVLGPVERHGFLISLNETRKQYNGPPKKSDFTKKRGF